MVICHIKLYANKFKNVDEMEKFLEKCIFTNLLKMKLKI